VLYSNSSFSSIFYVNSEIDVCFQDVLFEKRGAEKTKQTMNHKNWKSVIHRNKIKNSFTIYILHSCTTHSLSAICCVCVNICQSLHHGGYNRELECGKTADATRFDANKKVNKEENPAKNMVVSISISINRIDVYLCNKKNINKNNITLLQFPFIYLLKCCDTE
jgi:hypothetical protein